MVFVHNVGLYDFCYETAFWEVIDRGSFSSVTDHIVYFRGIRIPDSIIVSHMI